jgi:hypothetical protein
MVAAAVVVDAAVVVGGTVAATVVTAAGTDVLTVVAVGGFDVAGATVETVVVDRAGSFVELHPAARIAVSESAATKPRCVRRPIMASRLGGPLRMRLAVR